MAESIIADSSDEADFNNDHDQNNAKESEVKRLQAKERKEKTPALLASILKELLIRKLEMSYVFAKS